MKCMVFLVSRLKEADSHADTIYRIARSCRKHYRRIGNHGSAMQWHLICEHIFQTHWRIKASVNRLNGHVSQY